MNVGPRGLRRRLAPDDEIASARCRERPGKAVPVRDGAHRFAPACAPAWRCAPSTPPRARPRARRRRLLHVVLEQRRALAAQDDVEAVGAAVELHEGADVLQRDQAADLLLARRDAEDRAAPDQRVALEVHLGDEPLHPAVARDRVVDVRRPPVVDAVPPRVGAGLDRAVRVVAVLVGEHPAAAAEVGIEGADVLVPLVAIAAAGVALPDLDQRVLDRPAELVVDVAVDDDALADRHAVLGVVEDQVVVERAELVGAKDRRRHFGERLLQRDQRQLRAAQDARLVLRRVRRRVRRRVAHQEFGVGSGARIVAPAEGSRDFAPAAPLSGGRPGRAGRRSASSLPARAGAGAGARTGASASARRRRRR